MSGTRAIQIPQITTAQRDALVNPEDGMMVYNTDDSEMQYTPDGGATWVAVGASDDTLQEVYDNSANGNTNLAADKHITYTATDAAFRLSSMTEAQFDAIPTPPNGLMAWAADSDRVRINKGSSGSPSYDNLAYLTDITGITADAAYAEAYFQGNSTLTNIVTQGVPVQVAGTYISGDLLGFNQVGGVFTYTDSEARVVLVEASLTSTMDLSTADVSFIVFHNGIAVAKSTMSPVLDGVTPSPKSVSVSCLVSIGNGDTLDLRVQNDTDTDDILVQDLNFKATSLGGTSGASGETLQDAYDAGDGAIILSAAKPFNVGSTATGIVPEMLLNQQAIPFGAISLGQLRILSKNNASADVTYGLINVEAGSVVAGNEDSTVRFSGRSAGAVNQFMQYNGDTDTLVMTSNVNFANRTLSSVNQFTQNLQNSTFNDGQGNGQFLIKTAGNANAYTVDYTNNVAKYLIPLLMENSFGVNYTLGTTTSPTTTYPTSVFTSVWQTLNGSNILAPNSLLIGQTVEVDITGTLVSVNTGGTGRLQLSFSTAFTVQSSSISFAGTAIQRNMALKFKITNLDNSNVTASASGWYVDPSNNVKAFPIFINPVSIPFTVGSNNTISVEWEPTVSGGNEFNFVANNLNIIKYS